MHEGGRHLPLSGRRVARALTLSSSRRVFALALVGGMLAVSVGPGTAAAASFTGPFDSAHQPRSIQNDDIAAPDPADADSFTIGIGFSVGCTSGVPTPLTVTFTDPSGTTTDTLSDPCWGRGPVTVQTSVHRPAISLRCSKTAARRQPVALNRFSPTMSLSPRGTPGATRSSTRSTAPTGFSPKVR